MDSLFINKISFVKRPYPIPADYRPMYKIGLVTMILKMCCRAETSSLLKLHLLSWAISSDKNRSELRNHITSNFNSGFSVWGIEPALNRALQFAIADGVCELVSGKNYKLTLKGSEFFKRINADKELFAEEKEFLKFVGKNKITDSRIDSMAKKWAIPYA